MEIPSIKNLKLIDNSSESDHNTSDTSVSSSASLQVVPQEHMLLSALLQRPASTTTISIERIEISTIPSDGHDSTSTSNADQTSLLTNAPISTNTNSDGGNFQFFTPLATAPDLTTSTVANDTPSTPVATVGNNSISSSALITNSIVSTLSTTQEQSPSDQPAVVHVSQPVAPETPQLTPLARPTVGPNPEGTKNSAEQLPQHKSLTTPVVAIVIPLFFVCLGVCFFFWLRCRKRRNESNRADLEKEVSDDFNNSVIAVSTNRSQVTAQHEDKVKTPIKFRSETDTSGGLSRTLTRGKTQLNSTNLSKDGGNTSSSTISNELIGDAELNDPFLTPTSQTGFPSPGRVNIDPDDLRVSQIGLALTTQQSRDTKTPKRELYQNHNISAISLASSIRTVLHRASSHIANPFRNTSTVADSSTDSVKSTTLSIDTFKTAQTKTGPITKDPKPSDLKINPAQTISGNSTPTDPNDKKIENDTSTHQSEPQPAGKSTLTKSNTPPEDLARRWIEVLKLEAAQAQEASMEALRQAEALKSKKQNLGNGQTS